MCGICGKIHFDKSRKADPGLLRKMTAVLSHRGPDDSGISANGYVGLGHQRLSIIDLSDAGHQPMANEDHSIQIVFNGEIYNFEELRKDLEKRAISSDPTQTRKPSFTFMKKKVQTALSSFGECLPLPCGTAAKTFCFYPVTGPVKNRWSIRKQIIVYFASEINHSFRILQLFLKSKMKRCTISSPTSTCPAL